MDSFSRYNEALCDNKKPIIKTLHRDHSFILTILILRTILKMNVKIAEINPIIKTWISPYQPYQKDWCHKPPSTGQTYIYGQYNIPSS